MIVNDLERSPKREPRIWFRSTCDGYACQQQEPMHDAHELPHLRPKFARRGRMSGQQLRL
eukprot:1054783-Pleurochrysis_carterae.AAC.1